PSGEIWNEDISGFLKKSSTGICGISTLVSVFILFSFESAHAENNSTPAVATNNMGFFMAYGFHKYPILHSGLSENVTSGTIFILTAKQKIFSTVSKRFMRKYCKPSFKVVQLF